jgi:tetratricopeptide (TPR) repeat protein
MKTAFRVTCNGICLLVVLLASSSHVFSYDYFVENLSSMIKRATVIVGAEVVDIQQARDEHNAPIRTVTLKLIEIIAGKSIDPVIILRLPILDYEGTYRPLTPTFAIHERVIVHLKQAENGNWTTIGHDQGIFEIRDGMIKGSPTVVDNFKQQIRNVFTGRSDSIDIPTRQGKTSDRIGDYTGEGISKLGGEFHLLDPVRYGPTSGTITFRINPTGARDKDGNQLAFDAVKAALQRAVDSWNTVNNSYYTFAISTTSYSNSRGYGDGVSTVTFESDASLGSNGATWNIYVNGVITEIDMAFNRDNRWNTQVQYPSSYSLYDHPSRGRIGPVDLEDVASHELGHGVGLHHVGDTYSLYTLYPTIYSATSWWEKTWRRSLEGGDNAGKIYQDPYFATAGTQTNPKILLSSRGATIFDGSFTVPASCYFEVESGKTIQLGSGVTLSVNGALNATHATFDRSGSSGSWGGITFNSGSSGLLSGCIFRNASPAVKCNGVLPSINNCTFNNNSVGIWLNNVGTPSTHISADYFYNQNQNGQGIACYFSSPQIDAGTYIYNHSMGIFCLGSSPRISNSWLQNNAYGCYLVNNSPATIGGYNRLVSNGTGIYADYCNGVTSYSSDVYTMQGANKAVRATNSAQVIAQNNYWGQYPPNSADFVATNGAYIYYLPGATSPWTGSLPKTSLAASTGDGAVQVSDPPGFTLDQRLLDAAQMMADGKYDEVNKVYSQEFKSTTNSAKKKYVLAQLAECYRAAGRKDFADFLNSNVRPNVTSNDELYGTTLELENLFLIQDHKYQEALKNLAVLRTNFAQQAPAHKAALFNLGYIYSELLNDAVEGKQYFDELNAKYPDDVLTWQAMWIQGKVDSIPSSAFLRKEMVSPIALPAKVALLDNYPNPFNPSTTLKYELPAGGNVSLTVYDVLGREVTVLVKGYHEAGRYSVTWNASAVASGMYFAQFAVKDEVGLVR